jgi:hypothetical protein
VSPFDYDPYSSYDWESWLSNKYMCHVVSLNKFFFISYFCFMLLH